MLLRLLPEQVSRQWEQLWPSIEFTLPEPVPQQAGTRILQAILAGIMTCWVVVDEGDMNAVIVTSFVTDPAGTRSLLIYSLYGYDMVKTELWKSSLHGLRRWAESKGCTEIIAYTDKDNVAVLRLAKAMGGTADRVVVSIPIEEQEES